MTNIEKDEGAHSNTHLIVALSLGSGVAAFFATPLGAPLVTRILRRAMLALLARRHGLRCDPGTLELLAGAQGATAAALGAVVEGGARRLSFLRVAVPWLLRLREVRNTFALGLFFDRYAGIYAAGAALEGDEAARLRRAIDEAAPVAFRSALGGVLLYALGQAAQAAVAAPRSLWQLMWASFNKDEQGALDEMERVVEEDASGLFARGTALVEEQLRNTAEAALSAFWEPFDEVMGGP